MPHRPCLPFGSAADHPAPCPHSPARHRRRWLPLAVLAGALLVLGPVHANVEPERVELNFANAEITSVIKAVGQITGRNFIIDPRVEGSLNIVTNTPVPRTLTYDILLSALRLQGYTVVESGGITRVVPEADAKLHGVPVATGRITPSGTGLVTQVFSLRHESAAGLVAAIRPLVSPNNAVSALPATNTLVVTDYADNLARIAQIIGSLDVPQGDLLVIPLQHAAARDLAETVMRLLGNGGRGTADPLQEVTVVPDTHSNSLLVRAGSPSRLAAVRQVVASIDRPGAGGNIRVVYLRNAEATRVAETLRAILASEGSAPAAGNGLAAMAVPAPATPPATPVRTGDSTGETPTAAAPAPFAAAQPGTALSAGSMIQADAASNALIITAPDAIYNNLRNVIEQLDRRRAQVYVEALVAEITAERAADWGLQWGAASNRGSTSIIGLTGFGSGSNNLQTLVTNAAAGTPTLPGNGINIGIGTGSVTLPGIGTVPSLAVLARFLESDSKTNILSTPNLVTLDNEEAKIVIGRNLPFVTGQFTNTGGSGGAVNPFQTIERRDVGLTLRVRPQVSEGGVVKLAIYHEASSVVGGVDSANGPITNKRSIESTVLVDDGAIIALGGLIEDSYSADEEKVPLLGDIPVAGNLFKYNGRKRTKTNLVIFLRPVVLRDADSYAGLTASRYDYVVGQQQRIAGTLLPGERTPAELPAFGTSPPAVPRTRELPAEWLAGTPADDQAPAPLEERGWQ
ncbi:MAG: ral secretion pathway protein [Thauera sp.]|nr:type II secretion system secretin GspD [Thauera sp.]MDI3489121.1 ral secretion pathway protein [Thauera sp.]